MSDHRRLASPTLDPKPVQEPEKPERVIDLYEFADLDNVDWDAVGVGALAMLNEDEGRAKAA